MDGIGEIIGRIADGRMGDDEATEFLRVVFDDGLAQDELVEMTLAMRDSGTKIDWIDDISRRVVDKHSTGGVGDKVSISLAPALAACGAAVRGAYALVLPTAKSTTRVRTPSARPCPGAKTWHAPRRTRHPMHQCDRRQPHGARRTQRRKTSH